MANVIIWPLVKRGPASERHRYANLLRMAADELEAGHDSLVVARLNRAWAWVAAHGAPVAQPQKDARIVKLPPLNRDTNTVASKRRLWGHNRR